MDAGKRNDTSVTLCGELAGEPISAMALIGLGFRSISMSPASIGPVKAMLAELPVGELEVFFEENLAGIAQLPMRGAAAGLCRRSRDTALGSVSAAPKSRLATAGISGRLNPAK